jgi:RNA polymerase subunit RPABC4/transcription elongation factor Spt4
MSKKKECPSCAMMIDHDKAECPICGYEFPKQSPWITILAILLILVFLGSLLV